MDIGLKIKEKRHAAGLTQSQLAELSGVAVITIRQYESNKRQPRADQLRSIASALNVSMDYLVGWDNSVQEAKAAAKEAQDAIINRDEKEVFEHVCRLTEHYTRRKLDDPSGYYIGKRGGGPETFLTTKEFCALIKRIFASAAALIDSEIEIAQDDKPPK